jgi:hypothetical protein
VTYLFRPWDIAKLASKRPNTNRYQHDKNIPPQTQTLLTWP